MVSGDGRAARRGRCACACAHRPAHPDATPRPALERVIAHRHRAAAASMYGRSSRVRAYFAVTPSSAARPSNRASVNAPRRRPCDGRGRSCSTTRCPARNSVNATADPISPAPRINTSVISLPLIQAPQAGAPTRFRSSPRRRARNRHRPSTSSGSNRGTRHSSCSSLTTATTLSSRSQRGSP